MTPGGQSKPGQLVIHEAVVSSKGTTENKPAQTVIYNIKGLKTGGCGVFVNNITIIKNWK